MIAQIVLAVGILVLLVLFFPRKPEKTYIYAFQVYDNFGQLVYTKWVRATNELKAIEKIEAYLPKDYTYKLVGDAL